MTAWERNGRALRDIARKAVDLDGKFGPFWDEYLANGCDGHYSPLGLCCQIGNLGSKWLCPENKTTRWSITVKDEQTGECGTWDLRDLRRELEREAMGEPVQGVLL